MLTLLSPAYKHSLRTPLATLLLASCFSPDWSAVDSASTSVTSGGATGSSTAGDEFGMTTVQAPTTTSSGDTVIDATTTAGASGTTAGTAVSISESTAGASETSDISGTTGAAEIPASANLSLSFSQIKHFDFEWAQIAGVTHYQLYEQPDVGEVYTQILEDLDGATVTATAVMPLHLRFNARYILRACNQAGCSDSNEVAVNNSMAAAVGYFKASNTDALDEFGSRLAMSADGQTLAIGARSEDSSAQGIGGDQWDNAALSSGAVYVFKKIDDSWSQEAYLKASNSGLGDSFGGFLSMSADGDTLAVGAVFEDSNATGMNGDELDNTATDSGAVYIFARAGGTWSQQAYIKSSNSEMSDSFGYAGISLAGDGQTLAVGAVYEDSKATGVNGDQADNSMPTSGATYVFSRTGDVWAQQAYVKASNTGQGDAFGFRVSLSGDGNLMAVGAQYEDSDAPGINGDQFNDKSPDSGAVYLFSRSKGIWSQQSYLKASTVDAGDHFGYNVAVSGDGKTFVVSADGEDGGAAGINADQLDNNAPNAGAVYVFIPSGESWVQKTYLKPSNPGAGDFFGDNVALSHDGDILAVCAHTEDGGAQGINGVQADDSFKDAGAAYVFRRNDGVWSQKAYVKAPNPGPDDEFGCSPALSSEGLTLAIGGYHEDSNAMGIGGNQFDNSYNNAGAVYLY